MPVRGDSPLAGRISGKSREREAYNEYMRDYMREYSRKRRERVIELLGGVCVRCGTTEELDVHHWDAEAKSFSLGKRWHRAWADIEAELPKCMLLCRPCHREDHGTTAAHGTPQRYWSGCRCPACTQANTIYSREYKRQRAGEA